MKLDYCAVHSGALIAPGGEPNCLFIRHDDGRIMSQREIWAEIERLREIAGEGYPGIAHDMETLRAELERNRADLIIEADRANGAEAERDAARDALGDRFHGFKRAFGDWCPHEGIGYDYCLACRAEKAEAERDAALELLRDAKPLADPESAAGRKWMLDVRAALYKKGNLDAALRGVEGQ